MLRWFCRWGRGGVWVSLAEREARLFLGIILNIGSWIGKMFGIGYKVARRFSTKKSGMLDS